MEVLHSMKGYLYKLGLAVFSTLVLLVLSHYYSSFTLTLAIAFTFLLSFRYAFIFVLVLVGELNLDEESA